MSTECRELVWCSSVKPPLRWLLMTLADRANDAGECWPSLEGLADRLQVSRRQVVRLINQAEQAGYVARIRGGGRGHKTHYRLDLERLKGDAYVTVYRYPERVTSATQTVTYATRNSGPHVTRTVRNRQEPGGARASARAREVTPGNALPPPPPTNGQPPANVRQTLAQRPCPTCHEGVLREQSGKRGLFLSCSRYPDCRHSEDLPKPAVPKKPAWQQSADDLAIIEEQTPLLKARRHS